MKKIMGIVVLFCALFSAAYAASAPSDYPATGDPANLESQDQQYFQGQLGYQGQPGYKAQPGYQTRPGYPGQQNMQTDPSVGEMGESDTKSGADDLMLSLQGEPGDASLSLRWKMPELKQAPEAPPVFTLMYGTESGKYTRKLDVGSVTEYKLRGLQNHQTYFIRVQGTVKPSPQRGVKGASTVLYSDEIEATPLPDNELGSLLERSFSRNTVTLQDKIEKDPFKRELRQFGYDFFRNSLANGIPTDNQPVGNDYVIGPGDSLRIDLWGGLNARYELAVDRNGEITIPRVGAVKVWGLGYVQAKEAINRAISRYFKGYELNVTLGRLRTIQVFVVGEVVAPGTYHIGSLGTVVNALSAAGGPSKNGSLRTIRLLKGGKVAQEVDLYDMFLSGDRSKDIRLENGDTVFVPVIGPVAAVAGEVKRPAIYELKGKTPLPRLLAMAGGVTAAGFTGRIQLERFEENSARVVVDFEAKSAPTGEALKDVEVHDRDMVKVFPVNKPLREVVTLQGNVARPGEYQYRSGMRMADLIPGYEALLPESWLPSVEITRLALPDHHREVLSVNLEKALAGDPRENIPLQEQDTVRVFSRKEKEERRMVAINGQVVRPGSYDYYPNMTVRDLVTLAGSPKMNALLDSAELTRIVVEGGRAHATRLDVNLKRALAGDTEQNMVLQPNDVLIVRGIADWLDATERFVMLKGEVRYPGTYSIAKGEKLSSVIERAGGFTDRAYLKGARFTRVSVRETQQKRMDEVIARTEQDVLRKETELASVAASKEELEATKAALEGLSKSLEKLKAARAEGRVVLHLAALEDFKGSPYDIEVRGGDTLEIPQTPNVVYVMGQVFNPTTLIQMPGKELAYYLKKAGGPTRDADEGEMYVIKADGTVVSREQSSFGIRWDEEGKRWNFGGFMSASLDPGDTVVVPQKMERIAWMREIKDITSILANVALTAGVMVAAGL
ncbi:MAG TPA: SLBB domain-containing protein [Geobacteraceae bacterium]